MLSMAIRLKSPDWRVYVVESPADLQDGGRLYVALGLDRELAQNLRQLCGFDQVGVDRSCRRTTAGWHLVRDIQWVTHAERRTLVPVIGTVAQKLALIQKHEPYINGSEFKKMLNTKRKTPVDGWLLLTDVPTGVMTLEEGKSLLTFSTVRSVPSAQPSHCHGPAKYAHRLHTFPMCVCQATVTPIVNIPLQLSPQQPLPPQPQPQPLSSIPPATVVPATVAPATIAPTSVAPGRVHAVC